MFLETDRLILNSFTEQDAQTLFLLSQNKDLLKATEPYPDPYEEYKALSWIQTHKQEEQNNNYIYAIRSKLDTLLLGSIELKINLTHNRGFLSYWIGSSYWNQGFATEAVQKILYFAFTLKQLNRVWCHRDYDNTKSEKVLKKVGMIDEGILKQHKKHEEIYYDVIVSSILKKDFDKTFTK